MKPLRFHPHVQRDVDGAMDFYGAISESLADGFWTELHEAFLQLQRAPEAHHIDSSGLRRINLKRFTYNVLYLIKADRIRIQVVRHHSRKPGFGARRSKR